MEIIKKFYEALSTDEAMRERAKTLSEKPTSDEAEAMERIIAFAKTEGYSFTVEDLRAFFTSSRAKELSDEELENVAGGACKDTATCACFVGGGGTLSGVTCSCFLGGYGENNPGPGLVCVEYGGCLLKE